MKNVVDQYNNNRKRLSFYPYFNLSTEVIFTSLLLSSLFLLFVIPQHKIYQLKKIFFYLFSPVTSFTTKVFYSPVTFGRGFVELLRAKSENYKLHNELGYYSLVIHNLEEIRRENERLRKLLDFSNKALDFRLLPAEVLTRDFYNWYHSITLGKGRNDHVKEDDVVVALLPTDELAAVGRVVEVAENVCKVLLISDENSYIVGYLPDIGEDCLIRGTGSNFLLLEYLSPDSRVSPGNVVYTSGTGGVFPAGLKIGRVREVKMDEKKPFLVALVEPFLKVGSVCEVLILQKK